MEKLFVTSEELSELTSIPAYTIRKMTREGVLPAYTFIGRKYLYDPVEVAEIVRKYRLQSKLISTQMEERISTPDKGVAE